VADHADIWHGFGSPSTIARKVEVLDRWCDEVGRDPAEIERSVGVELHRIGLADQYRDIGVRQITLGFGGPHYDLAPARDWLAWRDEVNAGS
jgi:hypothetical protein